MQTIYKLCAVLIVAGLANSIQPVCQAGFGQINGAESNKCYHFNGDKIMNMFEAMDYCGKLGGFVVRPKTVDQISALLNATALRSLVGKKQGIWLGYARPAYPSNSIPVEQEVLDARIAGIDEFYEIDSVCPRVPMPPFWRLQSQPLDLIEEQDESCVAVKRPYDFDDRVDSFPCEKSKHYPYCESCLPSC